MVSIDEWGTEIAAKAFTIAFIINLVLALFLVLFGYLSDKNHRTIHIIGTILYGLDFFICLFGGLYLYSLFHIFGLFILIRGAYAQKKIPVY